MSRKLKTRENVLYLIVALISILLILVGVILAETAPTISSFVKELGIAGVISLIVIFTVEKITKERHRIETQNLYEKINKNLFHAIYNRYIAPKVFREAEKLLLSVDAYRSCGRL